MAAMALPSLLPVAAQQSSIQFSKPANLDPAAGANSFLPTKHKTAGDYNAPSSLFDSDSANSFESLPMGPAPVISSRGATQWQKDLEARTKWTLMTPEQILGIPTPESILGIADPNEDPATSAEERFLNRQQRKQAGASMGMGMTNGLMQPNGWLLDDKQAPDTFNDLGRETPFGRTFDDKSGADVLSTEQRAGFPFLSQSSKLLTDANHNKSLEGTWESPFSTPQPLPQSTPEQLAGMERFRAMLGAQLPSLQGSDASKTPEASIYSFKPVVSPNMEAVSPSFNPVGSSFRPLESDISRPTGIQPLAGVTGPQLPRPKAPALVQSPPWMSGPSANSAPPQRQF